MMKNMVRLGRGWTVKSRGWIRGGQLWQKEEKKKKGNPCAAHQTVINLPHSWTSEVYVN